VKHESHVDDRTREEEGREWMRAWMWIEAGPEQRPFPAPPLPVGEKLPILMARPPWDMSCCWLWVLLVGRLHFHMVFREYEVKRLTNEVFEITVTSTDPPLQAVVLLRAPEGGTG
jgi:hypothetical protein